MATKKKPEIINLSDEAMESMKTRVAAGTVHEDDKKILLSIICTYQWLHSQLLSAKLTIHRIKKMFGFSTEKRRGNKKGDPLPAQGDPALDPPLLEQTPDSETPPVKKY